MNIPIVRLTVQHAPLKKELMAAVERVLDHGQFVFGEEVTAFEQQFAELCGVRHALGVNSGTDALILALRAAGIGPGDAVINPPNSFITSAASIALVGATPVFVDVRDDYNINPELIAAAITPQTKAIMPVHLTGRPAAMDAIMEIAAAHKLAVIEDCAQAVTASYQGKTVGSIGLCGCFSLHPLKTLNACGDGGVLTTNDTTVYEKCLAMRNNGLANREECAVWSGNSRLDTMQAAMLLVKMQHLAAWTSQRIANARYYQAQLAQIPNVQLPVDGPGENAVYHTFIIQAENRDALQAYLQDRGIGTRIHYPIPIHQQQAAAQLQCRNGDFPNTERQAGRILSLPVYPELTREEQDYIVDCIRQFYEN